VSALGDPERRPPSESESQRLPEHPVDETFPIRLARRSVPEILALYHTDAYRTWALVKS
jgi:hypothetical protein